MKKLMSALLAICLLCGAAFAVEMEPAFEGQELKLNERAAIDLDGDGAQEEVLVQQEGVEGEEELALYVFGADGGVVSHTMYVRMMTGAFAADLDGDGLQEILISVDEFSDDYCTFAFRYSDETGLSQLQFANVARGEIEEDYAECGYGMVTRAEGNSITLTGSQDVLGTWMASRDFALQGERFETEDDGLYQMLDLTGDAEIWEYYCLIPTIQIPVKLADGSDGVLEPGEKFVVTASDRESIVYFETQDGKTGSISVEPDAEYGWGFLVNGEKEENCFEFVPYAD